MVGSYKFVFEDTVFENNDYFYRIKNGDWLGQPYEKLTTYTRAYEGARTSAFKYFVKSEQSGTFPGQSDYLQ